MPGATTSETVFSNTYMNVKTVEVIKWATSRENLSLQVSDQVGLKPACLATETS